GHGTPHRALRPHRHSGPVHRPARSAARGSAASGWLRSSSALLSRKPSEMSSRPTSFASDDRDACLGANCLAALFLQRYSTIDAHRAALDMVAGAGFGVTEITHPRLLPLQEAPLVRRHAEELGLAIRAVHAPPMRRDSTL